MGVVHPSHINEFFAHGFNFRDVDLLVTLYDPNGAVVERDGTVSHGHEAIRQHLEDLVAIGGEMTSTNFTAVIVGDIALVTAGWIIVGSHLAPQLQGRSSEVLRLQPDGSWAYLIDQPA
jgi:ketosteroid isomerase-like protein